MWKGKEESLSLFKEKDINYDMQYNSVIKIL